MTRYNRMLLSALVVFASSCVHFSPQTDRVTESWFEDPAPSLALDTPAFAKRSGFTRHDDLIAFLAAISAGATVFLHGRLKGTPAAKIISE